VRVDTRNKSRHRLAAAREKAFTVKTEKPRGKADKAYAAADVRIEADYSFERVPQSDGIVRLDAIGKAAAS